MSLKISKINRYKKNLRLTQQPYYNNGVTITCDSFEKKGMKLILDKPQVINGAQTVTSVYEALNRKDDIHKNKLHLMVRVIQTTKDEQAGFSKNVTKYNNSQNKIELQDHYANQPIHKKLHEKLKEYNIFYEYKRNEFETLSPEEKKKYESCLKVGDLLKIYNGFKYHDININKTNLYSEKVYNRVFSDDIYKKDIVKEVLFCYKLSLVIRDVVGLAKYELGELSKPYKTKREETLKDLADMFNKNDDYRKNLDVVKQTQVVIVCIGYIVSKLNLDIARYYDDKSLFDIIQKQWLRKICLRVNKSYEKSSYFKDGKSKSSYYKNRKVVDDFRDVVREWENDYDLAEDFGVKGFVN
ncbi:AIPR family protein [Francisella tularensis]|uniref:AIPR family protein n=1 Tax=Francisella tularensis TaxID=263 RepID=UPI0009B6E0AE|nr:AIPR family protein [Francisella tularensis]